MTTNNRRASLSPQEPDGECVDFGCSTQQRISKAARALCSCQFVVITLTVIIVIELAALITGATVKLNGYVPQQVYNRMAQQKLAAELGVQDFNRLQEELNLTREELQIAQDLLTEARGELAQKDDLINGGAAALSGSSANGQDSYTVGGMDIQPYPVEDGNEEFDHNAAPPLREADLGTLVFEETGAVINIEKEPTPTEAAAPTDAITSAFEKLSAEDAKELEHLIREGISALVEGDMLRCVQNFENAYSISTEHPALLYYYGMAYDKLRNPDKARKYYTEVFRMRSSAGKYYDLAKRRLEHSFEQPSDLRGKIAFGPYTHRHTEDSEGEETITMRLPILLAPNTYINPQDLLIQIQFYILVDNRKIQYAPGNPIIVWENEEQDWSDNEENILITYKLPQFSKEEADAYGDVSYYGFTAKCYYKEEPVDCISNPSALILHEQRIKARAARQKTQLTPSLLPDDGLAPQEIYQEEPATSSGDEEAATPFAEFIKQFEAEEEPQN